MLMIMMMSDVNVDKMITEKVFWSFKPMVKSIRKNNVYR